MKRNQITNKVFIYIFFFSAIELPFCQSNPLTIFNTTVSSHLLASVPGENYRTLSPRQHNSSHNFKTHLVSMIKNINRTITNDRIQKINRNFKTPLVGDIKNLNLTTTKKRRTRIGHDLKNSSVSKVDKGNNVTITKERIKKRSRETRTNLISEIDKQNTTITNRTLMFSPCCILGRRYRGSTTNCSLASVITDLKLKLVKGIPITVKPIMSPRNNPRLIGRVILKSLEQCNRGFDRLFMECCRKQDVG